MAPKQSKELPATSTSSDGYVEQDETTYVPVSVESLNINDPLSSGSSEGESEASSEGEDEKEADDDSKSTDFQQDGNGGDKSPPPDASGASASASASDLLPHTFMIPLPSEEDPEFTDEELLTMINSATDIDMKKTLLEKFLNPRASFYVQHVLNMRNEIKKIEKEESKAKRKEEKRIQKEQEKREMAEIRTRDFTLNIRMDGQENTKPVIVNPSMTVKDLRETVVRAHFSSMSKKASKSMKFIFGSTDMSLNPRKTLAKFGLSDGATVQLQFGGQGGGKRAKVNKAEEIGVILTPTPLPTDPQSIHDALNLSEIKFEPWLSSLPFNKIEKMVTTMEAQVRTGNIQSLINPYLNFVSEYEKLTVSNLKFNKIFLLERHYSNRRFLHWNATIPIGDFYIGTPLFQ